jgi:hypothetical protein
MFFSFLFRNLEVCLTEKRKLFGEACVRHAAAASEEHLPRCSCFRRTSATLSLLQKNICHAVAASEEHLPR